EHWPGSVSRVILAGQPAITGGWLSSTVTVKEQLAVLPTVSVAVYVTVVTPTGNTLPGVCVDVTLGVPKLSVAVGGVQVAMAEQSPAAAVSVMLLGQLEKCGGCISRTFTATVSNIGTGNASAESCRT